MPTIVPRAIVLHCSGTEDSETVSWGAIRRFHTGTLGWDDIGYHYGIEWVGTKYVLHRGRKYNVPGAHCKDDHMNWKSVGVCVVGEFDEAAPSAILFDTVTRFLAVLCVVLSIHPTSIYGHREFNQGKTCPGKMWNLDSVRNVVQSKWHKSGGDEFVTLTSFGGEL